MSGSLSEGKCQGGATATRDWLQCEGRDFLISFDPGLDGGYVVSRSRSLDALKVVVRNSPSLNPLPSLPPPQKMVLSAAPSLAGYDLDWGGLVLIATVALLVNLYILWRVCWKGAVGGSKDASSGDRKASPEKNCVLVIAHPDDEVMFFLPSLLALKGSGISCHLLCLTNGDYDGLGKVREKELDRSCRKLGMGSWK